MFRFFTLTLMMLSFFSSFAVFKKIPFDTEADQLSLLDGRIHTIRTASDDIIRGGRTATVARIEEVVEEYLPAFVDLGNGSIRREQIRIFNINITPEVIPLRRDAGLTIFALHVFAHARDGAIYEGEIKISPFSVPVCEERERLLFLAAIMSSSAIAERYSRVFSGSSFTALNIASTDSFVLNKEELSLIIIRLINNIFESELREEERLVAAERSAIEEGRTEAGSADEDLAREARIARRITEREAREAERLAIEEREGLENRITQAAQSAVMGILWIGYEVYKRSCDACFGCCARFYKKNN